MTIIDPVQQIVLNCLNHFAYQDAIFLSERLHAEVGTEETLYLLALSHYRSHKPLRVYHMLKDRCLKLPKAKYLLSQCCLELSKWQEAESILTSFEGTVPASSCGPQTTPAPSETQSSSQTSTSQKIKLHEEILREYGVEMGPRVLHMLAQVYSKTERNNQAVEYFKRSLRANPFSWESFEALCALGERVDAAKYFTVVSANTAFNRICPSVNDSINNINQILKSTENMIKSETQPQTNQPPIPVQAQQTHYPHQQPPLQPKHHPHKTSNVLKQIDHQQCDLLDQKTRQDRNEIAQILRMVEADQQSKVIMKQQQQEVGGTQISVAPPQQQQLVAHNSFKENTLAASQSPDNDDEDEEMQQSQPQNQLADNVNTTSVTVNPVDITLDMGQAGLSSGLMSNKQQTPLLNQAFLNRLAKIGSGTGASAPIHVNSQANPSTSSSNISMQTPPQLITSTNMTMAPPQKKVSLHLKRQSSSTTTKNYTFGQNPSNPGSSKSSTAIGGTQTSIRRSSRIYAAQNPLSSSSSSSSLTAANKAHSSSSSSSSSSTTSLASNPSTASSTTTTTTSKRLKKKSSTGSTSSASAAVGGVTVAATTSTSDANLAASSSGNTSGAECQHCNLLSCNTSHHSKYQLQLTRKQNQQSQHQQLTVLSRQLQQQQQQQQVVLDELMSLMRELGAALCSLKQFECEQALAHLNRLPPSQLQSPLCLSLKAKCHFELHQYALAEASYSLMHRLYPYHLDGVDYYSTTLWHLQKETQLSALAADLCEYDKLAPETWCALGNCFSLHKEHDAAIKFFQRAAQLDPKFVYAYNLLGHEYCLIEEMDKALACFRKAIYLDPRHYNAWYGISMIQIKQEKFHLAERYLKRALSINPHSSTLMCHIAVVYHALKQSDKAIQILDRALEIEPKNTLCKFHRASILFAMEAHEEALDEFEKLRRIIPKESLIYYMISKTHKKLKNVHLSLMYMSWAMDLDPKGVNNQLKESIDKRYVIDSDSTFARELETINTSTLEAIYGGSNVGHNTIGIEPADTTMATAEGSVSIGNVGIDVELPPSSLFSGGGGAVAGTSSSSVVNPASENTTTVRRDDEDLEELDEAGENDEADNEENDDDNEHEDDEEDDNAEDDHDNHDLIASHDMASSQNN